MIERWSVPPATATVGPVRSWLPAVLAGGFVTAGFFKGMSALGALPVDLTAALAVVVAAVVAFRLVRFPIRPQVHGIVGAFLLLVPAALFAAATAYGAEKVLHLFTLTLLAALAPVVLIRTQADVERFVWALVGFCGLVVLIAVGDPQPVGDYAGAPRAAEGIDTIALGHAAGLVLVVIALALMWQRIPWLLAVPAGGLAVYVLLQSGARGPLFATVAALVVGAAATPTRPPPGRSVTVVAISAAGLLAAFTVAPFYARQRISELLAGGSTGTIGERASLYRLALDSMVRDPFGIGLGGYERLAFLGNRHPHNLVLEVLVEAGILLGGLFLLWLALQYWRARQAAVWFGGAAAFTTLTFLLLTAMVSGDLNDNRLLFFVLGTTMAAHALHVRARPASGVPARGGYQLWPGSPRPRVRIVTPGQRAVSSTPRPSSTTVTPGRSALE